jgi:hypothetical protein
MVDDTKEKRQAIAEAANAAADTNGKEAEAAPAASSA